MLAALLLLVASSSAAAAWPPPPTWPPPPALQNRPRSPQYITEPTVFRHGSFVYRAPPSLQQYPEPPSLRPATPSSARLTTAQLAYVLIGSCTALSVLCLAAVAGCSFHRCRRQRHTASAAAAARAATHLLDPSWSLGPRNVGGTFGRCRLPFGAASSLRVGGAGPAPSECSTCVPPPRCTCVAAAGDWSMPVCWSSNDERLV